ncbi:MAG: hypothetical protein JWQ40_818 [Segetibacter sp.]|nr:hypothetical protein [Segetibacter sp.]
MKPNISPLHVLDFAITAMDFSIVSSQNEEEDLTSYFQKYEIDIDFTLSKDQFLTVYIKTEINRSEEKLPGYTLMAEAACIFKFDEEAGLPDNIQQNLEGFSTIYIALNSLRGLISNFTANGPFGRYILPSIDLNDLIEKKKALLKVEKDNSELKEEKKRNPKKTKKSGTNKNK